MAAAAVLTREKDFEDLLGSGKLFVAPDRQYIRLADDVAFPRTDYSLQALKEYALRAQQRRRFWEDLGQAADEAGVPLSSYAYAQGAHQEAPDTSELVSDHHDDEAHAEQVGPQRHRESHWPPAEGSNLRRCCLWCECDASRGSTGDRARSCEIAGDHVRSREIAGDRTLTRSVSRPSAAIADARKQAESGGLK